MKHNIYNFIKPVADKSKVVSFDIFDTLLFRHDPSTGLKLSDPDQMFFLMEQKHEISGFANNRLSCESVLRQLTYSPDNTSAFREITLDGIYKLMDPKFAPIQGMEIDWEIENIIPNEPMIDAFHKIRQSGKPVVITSDMYLNINTITKMLQNIGIAPTDYAKLYLSSHIGKTKSHGKLYPHIQNDLKIKPNELTHIGDSFESDYKNARNANWHALWYNNGKIHT